MQANYDYQVVWGMIATFAAAFAVLVWLITDDDSQIERDATRWGLFGGLAAGVVVMAAEWGLFAYIDANAGAFMLVPSIGMAFIAFWKTGRHIYRRMGCGLRPNTNAPESLPVETAALAQQGEIWCRLRELPQFLETTGGDLLNFFNADQIYWGEYKGARCMMFSLGGKTKLTGVRFESLTKYLAVQEGIARRLLDPQQTPREREE